MLNRKMFDDSREPVPAGDYLLEITKAYIKPCTNGSNKLNVLSTVAEPESLEDRTVYFSMFLGNNVAKLLAACGSSIDNLFGTSEEISEMKLSDALVGHFIRARLGVKNGFNELIEAKEDKDESQVAKEAV